MMDVLYRTTKLGSRMRGDVKSNNEDKHVVMSRVWGCVFVNTVNAVIYILRAWQVSQCVSE